MSVHMEWQRVSSCLLSTPNMSKDLVKNLPGVPSLDAGWSSSS